MRKKGLRHYGPRGSDKPKWQVYRGRRVRWTPSKRVAQNMASGRSRSRSKKIIRQDL